MEKEMKEAQQALAQPLARLPSELLGQLPSGVAGMEAALRLLVLGHAPAGARGFRVGTLHGQSRLLRWFPSSLRRRVPIFFLEPFEQLLVPVPTIYTVAYTDEKGQPIGGARFTLELKRLDLSVRYCDGDRSLKPRLRP